MNNQQDLYLAAKTALSDRGVDLNELAILVCNAQRKHNPDITEEIAMHHINSVLKKREIQHAILTGIALDVAAEQKLLPEPLLGIIERDEGLYGVDETLAMSITGCYGSIASSNFGYFDITKPGIIGLYNDKKAKPGEVHTFLDDILCSIVAASCSRLAHRNG
ncbi:phosphatidylglycerophosphatase A family protein [Priestia megaterium]|uniref:Phosphatidylglycerophosphatase A n=1 Tax=Priestia megaterium TaxID=1404 RepID=A0A6M6EAT8_PRIMG|nr:phosphatidylglycerophosphatase A [Priestia megaterium]QJX80675.1 phosphatidylglycerophosphatase A [Priestia megaterium]